MTARQHAMAGVLRPDVVYRAPSGRRCRYVPSRKLQSYAVLEYLPEPGQVQRHVPGAAWAEGFFLTPANYGLLEELPDVPHRRPGPGTAPARGGAR